MRTRLIESAPALSLALTAVSCWVVGIAHTATYRTLIMGDEETALQSVSPLDGVWFAVGILGILGTHELGHWCAARRHRLAVSLPLFIPGPTFAGTFGAFMRLRGRPPTRRCAFDIAAAGPLAGFAALLPVLWAGVALSHRLRSKRWTPHAPSAIRPCCRPPSRSSTDPSATGTPSRCIRWRRQPGSACC